MFPNSQSIQAVARCLFTVVLGGGLLLHVGPVQGQDSPGDDKGPATKKETAAEQPPEVKPRVRSSDDDDLFKQLTGDKSKRSATDVNPLQQAIEEMRKAQQRIGKRDTGEETRKLQENVVSNLQMLIEKIKQQSQSSPSSSGGSPMPSDDESNQQNSQPPEPKPADNGQTRDDKSEESTDEPRDAENRKIGRLTPGQMDKEVWGHLPPKLRQQLLNAWADKYLPKYDDLVRRYFESLAEEGRPTPKR